jgi:hypothetical protein
MVVRLSVLHASRPLLPGRLLVLISVRGWVHPRAIVWLEGLSQLKNPMTHNLPACSIVPQPIIKKSHKRRNLQDPIRTYYSSMNIVQFFPWIFFTHFSSVLLSPVQWALLSIRKTGPQCKLWRTDMYAHTVVNRVHTELTGTVAMLLTHIQERSGLNLIWDTSYPD